MEPQKSSGSGYRAIALVSAIGTEFAGCVLGGLYLGKWLDAKWATTPWLMILGIFLGLAAGIVGILQITKAFSSNQPE